MTCFRLVIGIVLAGWAAGAIAQYRPGPLDPRYFGQPLMPRPNRFAGGLQISPGGSFQGLNDRGMFAAPWRQPPPLLFPIPMPDVVLPSDIVPQTSPNQALQQPVPQVTFRPMMEEPPTARPIGGFSAIAPSADVAIPPVFSATLSDRLTRIAQRSGVQCPTGIAVYLRGSTAVLRGIVATPHDRQLIQDLTLLEPGVWRIDNQLVVGGPSISPAIE